MFDCKRCKIHKTYGFCTPERLSRTEIVFIGTLQKCIFKVYAVDDCIKGGVPAVIRPVGVKNSQLRDSRFALFCAEIRLAERYVICIHGEAVTAHKFLEFCAI